MATKIFCDCCGKEIKGRGLRTFSYGVHMEGYLEDNNLCGYVDFELNSISGRNESYDVCGVCYNRVMLPSVKMFHEMRDKAIKDGKFSTDK